MKPPEEVRREFVRQWLDKAESDFKLAEHLISENAPFLEAACLHAQQAAEKYLKAFLVEHQVEFPKTHNLGHLLDLSATIDSSLVKRLQQITVLNPYGVDYRYPGDFPEITRDDAGKALKLVGMVRDAILRALK